MEKRRAAISECVGCGCNDLRACIGGCWWLEVDTQRGIGVCSQCGLDHKVRVFVVGDSDWWAGAGTSQEILAAYMKETGCTHEECAGDEGELPHELTLLQLHRTYFAACKRGSAAKSETFFERLNEMVKSGATFPCAFAGKEP